MAPNKKAPDIHSNEKLKINDALSTNEVAEAPETTIIREIDNLSRKATIKLLAIHYKYIANKIYEAKGAAKIPFLKTQYEKDRKKSVVESEKVIAAFAKDLDGLFDQPKVALALAKIASAEKEFSHKTELSYATGFWSRHREAINIDDGAPENQNYSYSIKKAPGHLRPTVLVKPSNTVG